MKSKYEKPKVKKREIKLSFFRPNKTFDSLDELAGLNFDVYASSHCCLLPGTKITMKNGTKKEIQNIVKGDQVLSFNLASQTPIPTQVKKLLIYTDSSNGYYIVNRALKVTGQHPIWINGKQWVQAEKIQVGDQMLNQEGNYVLVKSISHITGKNTVYDLAIEENEHNFFAENTLVHNKTHW